MSDAVSTNIVIGRQRIPYRLVRSGTARKLRLSMTMDEFRVTAPSKAGNDEIQRALSKKHKWIIESYAALQEKYEQTHKIARFRTGAKLPYWGRVSQLKTQLVDIAAPQIIYRKGFYVQHPNYASAVQHDDAIEAALHGYLRRRFVSEVQLLSGKYAEQLGVSPKSVRVTEMRRRWGSCTRAGNVTLDWRLVYGPKRVAAYVLAHELAHLVVGDHSSKFWNVLGAVYGENHYERGWLKNNEHMLGYQRVRLDSAASR